MNKILIHRGDCTVFADCKRFLTFNLETDLDLTGWKANFILGWINKEIEDISSRSFEVVLGSDETKQLKLGSQSGAIILTDAEGHIKTVANNIPFEVTTAVIENEYQEIDLTIPESSGVDIRLKVGASTVTSVNGMTGDVVINIPNLEGYVKDTDYASDTVAGVVKVSGGNGVYVSSSTGNLIISKAQNADILSKTSGTKPIVPNSIDYAVKVGVTTNTIELTADEKANAKAWLGYADSTDIMQAIASIPQFKLSIVEALPTTGEKMTLYFVPKDGADNDIYNEYVWIEQTSSFEHLGSTAVDLTDYVKNTDYATANNAGLVKPTSYFGTSVDSSGAIHASLLTLEQYNAKNIYAFVGKGTLDNVLTQYSKTVLTTEADYNALATKDSNTLYLIEE